MTIGEMYDVLLSRSKNPDPRIYDQFREAVGQHIEQTLQSESPENANDILPLNYEERIDYIDSRPYQYHSIVQLKNLYDEFGKRAASYRIRHKK
ncbi:YpoC family protein [Salinicoccus sp. HZC-1]|uniref:YpoC family protein n=1 Tax=Salinicoccus sp. HZC-1 TaxID=3385497 RepID=UPI00398A6505